MSDAIDRNVEAVRERLLQRAQAGFAKYGVTTERSDLSAADWLLHLQEELLDAAVYVERLKRELAIAEARGWRSMESAPKDGAEVIVAFAAMRVNEIGVPSGGVTAACWAYDGWHIGFTSRGEHIYAAEPDGWQPLPPPPKESDERTAGTVD